MPKRILRLALPILLAGLLVAGLALLGRFAREQLVGHDRYSLAFSAIDCRPPPELSREEFLSQVQYLAGLPDRIRLLDRQTPLELALAFGRHPWVERVERVELGRARASVRLVFREPVLAVAFRGQGDEKQTRAVDRAGVLLPVIAGCAELPVFHADPPPSDLVVGMAWADERVQSAARTAAALKPHAAELPVRHLEIDSAGAVWLQGPRGRLRWGPPPDAEDTSVTIERRVRDLLSPQK
jgi:hypothetical protein